MAGAIVIVRAHRPLAPSAATATRVRRHCAAIMRTKPNSATDHRDRWALEHLLMRVLKTARLRGIEQVIRGAAVPGLVPEQGIAGQRRWVAQAREAGELRIYINNNQYLQSVSVLWSTLPKPLSPAQAKKKKIHDAFYARYMAAGQRAYATPPQRISRDDRRILLVGEFEADVNNGGFSQYLGNKGRARAARTAATLREIGAKKTAAMLDAALQASSDEAALSRLDDRFYRGAEDLALLSMRALER